MPSADIADAGRTVVHDAEPVRIEAEAETLEGFDGPPSPIAVPGLLGLGGLGGIQRKISVGAAADPLEDEAEANAAAVVTFLRRGGGTPPADPPPADAGADAPHDATAHRHHLACEHAPKISRRGDAGTAGGVGMAGGDLDDDVERTLSRTRGTGTALPGTARRAMESAMGFDFSAVRVHSGPTAARLSRTMNADAFALGPDIYFRDGVPDVSTPSGAHLLAHELTHTVQQGHAAPVDGAAAHRTIRRMGHGSPGTTHPGGSAATHTGGGGKGQVSTAPAAPKTAQPAAQAKPVVHRQRKALSVANCFAGIGELVDELIPTEGDSASLEVKVTIPIGASGIIGTIDAKVEIAREHGYKIGGTLLFGAGFKNMFIEAKIEAGYALEAVGKTPLAAGELLNLGVYEQVKRVSSYVAEEIWGSHADAWANGVAKRDLVDKETHVDSGLSTRAGAKLGTDGASVKFQGTYTDQTRYAGEEHGVRGLPGAHRLRVIQGSQKIDIEDPPVGILFAATMEHLDGRMASFSMKASVEIGASVFKGLTGASTKAMVSRSLATISSLGTSMIANAKKDPVSAGQVSGAVTQAATSFVPGGAIESFLEKQFASLKGTKVEAKSSYGFEFGIKVEMEDGGKQTTSASFELTQVQSAKVELDVVGGASIEAEKKTRLVKGGISTGGGEHTQGGGGH